jgi:Ala-tRNA(Pro) deacylase
VQLGKIHKHFNRYIVLASEQNLYDLFEDCTVGAVPPLGDAYDIDVIFDNNLYERDDVYFEAGDHTDLIHVSGVDFRDLLSNARHGEISQHI